MKKIVVLLAVIFISSAAAAEMYTWKDTKGTRYYTNSLHEIPARYLKRARVLDIATGKLGAPATALPGTPSAQPSPAGQAAPPAATPLAQPVPAAPTVAPVPAPPAPVAAQAPAPDPAPVPQAAAPQQGQRMPAAQRRAQRRAAQHRGETD